MLWRRQEPRRALPLVSSAGDLAHLLPRGGDGSGGQDPARYHLTETPRADYLQRTEWNVRDTDGTVIFTVSAILGGGSKRTAEFAAKHGKPCLHLSGIASSDASAALLQQFIERHNIRVLNVAGSRGSKEPDVVAFVHEVLQNSLSPTG